MTRRQIHDETLSVVPKIATMHLIERREGYGTQTRQGAIQVRERSISQFGLVRKIPAKKEKERSRAEGTIPRRGCARPAICELKTAD